MQLEYRQIIQNIELTKEEAQTLDNAKDIYQRALTVLYGQPHDDDLREALQMGFKGLETGNARLNVNIILDEE